jgi:hypothetical protein
VRCFEVSLFFDHDFTHESLWLTLNIEIIVSFQAGLKALKKESREKLDAYQRLFYLLQTMPVYLAKLVFAMPQMKTTKFMESVIFTLYNFGANQREEYLLLKLFQTALEEEVESKVRGKYLCRRDQKSTRQKNELIGVFLYEPFRISNATKLISKLRAA